MNGIIDKLPTIAQWKCEAFNLKGYLEKKLENVVWFKSIAESVKVLVGHTHLVPYMKWAPKQYFSHPLYNLKYQQYSEMWTGDWWWNE